MTKRIARKVLTSDRAIGAVLNELGCAVQPVLQALTHRQGEPSISRARLDALVSAGWLQARISDIRWPGRPERLYALTGLGTRLLVDPMAGGLAPGWPSHCEMRQQLLAGHARVLLEAQVRSRGAQILAWIPERVLRSRFMSARREANRLARRATPAALPDVEVTIREADGTIYTIDLELDGSCYAGIRGRAKVAALAATGRPIVWACEPRRASWLLAETATYPTITVLPLGGDADEQA